MPDGELPQTFQVPEKTPFALVGKMFGYMQKMLSTFRLAAQMLPVKVGIVTAPVMLPVARIDPEMAVLDDTVIFPSMLP